MENEKVAQELRYHRYHQSNFCPADSTCERRYVKCVKKTKSIVASFSLMSTYTLNVKWVKIAVRAFQCRDLLTN